MVISERCLEVSISAKTKIGVFDDFSAVYARNGFILGQVARTRLYLSCALAFELKCGFHTAFGCSKVDSDGP